MTNRIQGSKRGLTRQYLKGREIAGSGRAGQIVDGSEIGCNEKDEDVKKA